MRSKRLVPRPETDVKLTAIQLGLLSVGAVGYAVAAQGVGSMRVPFLVSGIALATVAAIVLPRYLRFWILMQPFLCKWAGFRNAFMNIWIVLIPMVPGSRIGCCSLSLS